MSKIRPRHKQLIIAGLAGVVLTASIFGGVMVYNGVQQTKKENEIRAAYQKQIDEMKAAQIAEQEKKKSVLLLKKDIQAGTKIKPDDLQQVELNEDEVPANSLVDPKEIVNKTIKIDAAKNTAIIPSILYDEGVTPNDLRYQEFNVMQLPSDLANAQYVDVRINFPTGHDYIVLSKKKVQKLVGATGTVWYEMNESEILTMSSAIVDAFINGARIYALTYTDPQFQEKAITTYPVNNKVLELMQNDPNIIEVAKVELNKRLRNQLDKDLSSLNEVDKMKYTTGATSYQVNNGTNGFSQNESSSAIGNEEQQLNDKSSNEGVNSSNGTNPTEKSNILEPTTDNSIPEDKQQNIFEQNQDAINP
ncbi:SAF domain-containing protein [Paenibacillus glucanolyticus]|jgi:Flp pilus assembly protein CpaB|uniref:SAF domain-containing protein n=1 Tax=Paenibacillus glucanolyticus TaxID=59843 RepID=A0A163GNE5_9BACL|nr:SAF domain-containing protein [Paenibacillus glucanolyticus]KZS45059.1 hypothetical protein AWU65_03495 [Paenibacillus glucanolyticus]OMF64132.1 hypothetical protein BK142_32225 [Paenibacillus glucanolyticus]